MPVPALNQCTLQRPTQEHRATAVAQVPLLDQLHPGYEALLAKHGFSKTGENLYEAADGSWIQFNRDRWTWERGIGAIHFQGTLYTIWNLTPRPYDPITEGLQAIATLPKLSPADLTASTAALTKAGFAAVLPNYFSHGDGSWVAFVGGKMLVGIDGERVTGFPEPGSAERSPAANSRYPRFTDSTLPKDWDEWRSRFAVAKVPVATHDRFTAAELTKIFKRLGFESTGHERWTHPDGSQVTTDSGNIMRSEFQRWSFDDFPFYSPRDKGRWDQETADWQDWVRGRCPRPPHGLV